MERKLKVRYLDGSSRYVGIKLQGKWLEDAGYKENDELVIKVKKNRIVIEKAPID